MTVGPTMFGDLDIGCSIEANLFVIFVICIYHKIQFEFRQPTLATVSPENILCRYN